MAFDNNTTFVNDSRVIGERLLQGGDYFPDNLSWVCCPGGNIVRERWIVV